MNQTTNYSLSQWEKSDRVLMDDFNADNAKIDAALSAQASTLSAHTAQIARLGNCQIWTTTYKGTGAWGPERPTSLTFPKKPVAALISNEFGFASWLLPEGLMGVSNGDKYFTNVVTWSGNTASWYVPDVATSGFQLNSGYATYYVVAFLPMDK